MLDVRNLSFCYGKTPVLKDVSFTLARGECMALLGANGAGKSTLLRCICHLLRPSGGQVLLDAVDTGAMTPGARARKIALVPQQIRLPAGTVFDAVLSGRIPHFSRTATADDLAVAERWLDALSLSPLALRDTRALSGGEQQKVALARALTQSPSLLILDEVTSSLDMKNQLETVRQIRDLAQRESIAVLMTVHDVNLALRVADRFLLLDRGRTVGCGGTETLTPDSLRTLYGVDTVRLDSPHGTVIVPRLGQSDTLAKERIL